MTTAEISASSTTESHGPNASNQESLTENEKQQQENETNDKDDVVMETVEKSILSGTQEQAVNAVFERLFGYSWGTTFSLEKPTTRAEILLSHALGADTAARVLQSNPSRSVVHKKVQSYKHRRALTVASTNVTVKSTPTATEATPDEGTRTETATPANTTKGGVGQLLQTLAGASKTTVVAKTSADWDQFKQNTGLGEQLEEHAEGKTAYLKRQDFLQRVDHRKFELEKEQRERQRWQQQHQAK